jgi:hypothetical protein
MSLLHKIVDDMQAEDDETFGSDQDEPMEEAEEGMEEAGGGFQATKRRLAGQGEALTQRDTQSVQKLLEEYNKLEYEDIVAGMPTRFRYANVGPPLLPGTTPTLWKRMFE